MSARGARRAARLTEGCYGVGAGAGRPQSLVRAARRLPERPVHAVRRGRHHVPAEDGHPYRVLCEQQERVVRAACGAAACQTTALCHAWIGVCGGGWCRGRNAGGGRDAEPDAEPDAMRNLTHAGYTTIVAGRSRSRCTLQYSSSSAYGGHKATRYQPVVSVFSLIRRKRGHHRHNYHS